MGIKDISVLQLSIRYLKKRVSWLFLTYGKKRLLYGKKRHFKKGIWEKKTLHIFVDIWEKKTQPFFFQRHSLSSFCPTQTSNCCVLYQILNLFTISSYISRKFLPFPVVNLKISKTHVSKTHSHRT